MSDGIRMVKILSVITIGIVFLSQGDLELDEEVRNPTHTAPRCLQVLSKGPITRCDRSPIRLPEYAADPPSFAGLCPIPPSFSSLPPLTLLLVSTWQGFLADGVANATSAVNATGEVLKAAAAAVAPLPLLEDGAGDEFGN